MVSRFMFAAFATPFPRASRRLPTSLFSLLLGACLAFVPAAGAQESSSAALDAAIARGDTEAVKSLLTQEPALAQRAPAEGRMSPLHSAILRRRVEIVGLLLEHGANPDTADSRKRSPLHMAVERGDAKIVAALLARKANPARRDSLGWTPLHHAGAKNQLEIARLLLDAGTDPNVRSELGGTPLHEAAASGGPELVQLLLDRGTDPTVRSKTGVTALDVAREFKNAPAIAILEKLGPPVSPGADRKR